MTHKSESVLAAVNSNTQGSYNYKQFIQHIFGFEEAEQLLQKANSYSGMDGPRTFRSPDAVQGAANNSMGDIGNYLINAARAGINYEDSFLAVLSPPGEYRLQLNQINDVLRKLNI